MTFKAGIEYPDPRVSRACGDMLCCASCGAMDTFLTVLDNLVFQQSHFQQGRHEVRSQLVFPQAHDSCTDV